MNYSQLAIYLHTLASRLVEHSKLPITPETIQNAEDYRNALTAVYPLLLTELEKISSLKTSPTIPAAPITLITTTQPLDEMKQNRRRVLDTLAGDKRALRKLNSVFMASMPEYQSYYKIQYMKPYTFFAFVSPRGDDLYDNYYVSSEFKNTNAKIKEAKVIKRSLLGGDCPDEETIVFVPERKTKTITEQHGASNILTGWKFKDSGRILVAGVADDEGRLIFDGKKYPDDFPRFTSGQQFGTVKELAELYDKTRCMHFKIIKGTRIIRPHKGFRFYSGKTNGSYRNYEVVDPKHEELSATVRSVTTIFRRAGNDYEIYGPEETIILNIEDIPENAGINYTKNLNINFWTLNGEPLYAGVVSNEGYTLDIYSDEPLQYKYQYDRDDNDAPIPVLNLIADIHVGGGCSSFVGVYYVSEINDDSTITLANLESKTGSPTYKAVKVLKEREFDVPGIVRYGWVIDGPPSEYSLIHFGSYGANSGRSHAT